MSCQNAQPGNAAADASRKLRRTDAALFLGLEVTLDDAIFQRVEADNGDPPSRPQDLQRGGERRLQAAKLIVHRDTQRLERPRGWRDPAGPTLDAYRGQPR